jgi:hypothetical protein
LKTIGYTKVQRHFINNIPVWIKREDLAGPSPGPSFSKVRGLWVHMQKLKEQGVQTIGYVETPISMAGWGVAAFGNILDLHVVIFDPQYVSNNYESYPTHEYHRRQWKRFGVEIQPVPAGRSTVNLYIARKRMTSYPNSIILPLGLPLPETVEETAKQAEITIAKHHIKTIVVSVGSGTICAGILRGINPGVSLYGVLCRTGNIIKKKAKIYEYAGITPGGVFNDEIPKLELVDLGYNYTQREDFPAPFPCHPYYDRKGWKWLVDNLDKLEPPVMFWNIGA